MRGRHLLALTFGAVTVLGSTGTGAAVAHAATPANFNADGIHIRTGSWVRNTSKGLGYRSHSVTAHCYAPGQAIANTHYWIHLTDHTTGVTGYSWAGSVMLDPMAIRPC